MRAKRKERIKSLIALMNSVPGGIRYSILSDFAKKHGVSYETIKEDLVILSYATIPSPRGFNLVYVPRSYRKGVRDVWSMFNETKEEVGGKRRRTFQNGELIFSEAQTAAVEFLMHTPDIDIERLRLLGPVNDKIIGLQKKFVDELKNLTVTVTERGVHPVRAHLDAWRIAGVKVHKEIENALRKAPPNLQVDIIEKIWEMNLHKARAARHYQSFITKYLNLLQKEYGVSKPAPKNIEQLPDTLPIFMEARNLPKGEDAIWKRLRSDVKNLRRWYWPSRRRAIPKNLKGAVRNLPYYIPKDKWEDPFIKAMLDAYTHLDIGDYFYKKAKDIEREIRLFI